jgi:hypothetical protein
LISKDCWGWRVGIETNPKEAYNNLYDQETRNKLLQLEEIFRREGLPKPLKGRAAENLRRYFEENFTSLYRFIRNNPDGFTIRIDGIIPKK